MKWQSFVSAEKRYQLEYPAVWEVAIIENIPTFFDPLFGDGVFQVSYQYFNGQRKDRPTLSQFFRSHVEKIGLPEKEIQKAREGLIEDQRIVALETMIDGHFVFFTILQKENHFLMAVYNSKQIPNEELSQVISQMVQSIRFLE